MDPDRKLRVLDVGQCDLDHSNITRMLKDNFEVAVDRAKSAEQVFYMVGFYDYDLVLINRIFDQDGSEGLELLRQMRSSDALRDTPAMLVSNHAEAQDAAVEAGALLGFGKAELANPETIQRLRACLESSMAE